MALLLDRIGLRGNALVVGLHDLIRFIGNGLFQSFWSLYVLELDASVSILGLFIFIPGMTNVLLATPIGYLADRVGAKKPLIVLGVLASIGCFSNALGSTWWHLIPGILLYSSNEITVALSQIALSTSLPSEKRGVGFASRRVFMMASGMTMPILGGIYIDKVGTLAGVKTLLMLNSGLGLIAALLLFIFYHEKVKTVERERPSILEMFEPLKNRSLRLLALDWGTHLIILQFNSSLSPIYAVQIIGLSKTQFGLVRSTSSFMGLIAQLPMGFVIDRFGRKKCIIIASFVRPIYLFAYPFATNLSHLIFLGGFSTVLEGTLGVPARQALISDATPESERGRAFGSTRMIAGFMKNATPTVGAFTWDNFGPFPAFFSASLICLSLGLIVVLKLKEPRIRSET